MRRRGPCTFRQEDLTRALKAAVKAGIEVARFEIDKAGKIVVVTGKAKEERGTEAANAWDEVLSEDAR